MATDLPTPDPKNRSIPTADDPDMLNGNRQSSRELSCAAIESERLAQEERRRVDSIEEQIRALIAQQQDAEARSRKYREEAEARQQDAREQSFFEVQTAKQADFRRMISDEVFTRVARDIDNNDDRDYIKALAERRPGFEDPVFIKCLLWNAIAGDESEFLIAAAQKVSDCFGRKISDADVAAVKSSVVCLASDVVAMNDDHPQSSQSQKATSELDSARVTGGDGPLPRQAGKTPFAAVNVVDKNQLQTPTDTRTEEDPTRGQEIQAVSSFSCEASQKGHNERHNERHDEFVFKQEPVIPEPASGGHRSMEDIDKEGENEPAQSFNAMSADPLTNFLHDEDADMLSIRGRSTTPATPSKRPREDISVASKRTSQPKTPKRPRTAKDSNPSKSSGRKQALSY